MGYNLGRYGTTSPTETMKETGIGAYPIIRNSNASIVWGYPSQAQSAFFSTLLYFFVFLSWGLYLLLFKPSDTSKGKKTIKVIGFILLWFSYSGILSLHYFDSIEFIPIICITGLAFLCLFVFAKDKHIETELTNEIHYDNLPKHSIQQEIKLKDCSKKKHCILLLILGYIISILLVSISIICFYINKIDYNNKWDFDYPWHYENNLGINAFFGLTGLYEFYNYYCDGTIYYYSIPEDCNLSELRSWLSNRVDIDETLPYFDTEKDDLSYYSLQEHPILKHKEVYHERYYNSNGYLIFNLFIIDGNMFYRLHTHKELDDRNDIQYYWCNKKMAMLLSSDYQYPINHINSTNIRITKGTCYFLSGLCLAFWMFFVILYYSRRINEIKATNGVINRSALKLSRHVFFCTIFWFLFEGFVLLWVYYNENNGFLDNIGTMVIGIIMFIINMFILRYTINKISQEPSEDYLIPKWFKLQNANVLKNMGIVRLFLLFVFWPIFVLIPVPYLGGFAIMYSIGVLLLFYLVFYGIKGVSWITTWIISGTKTKVSYKEKE